MPSELQTKYKHTLAFAAIVKGTDEEADMLRRLLNNISPHVNGIFITITQPNKKVEEVAKWFGAEVSHFKWIDDFAAARNFNFSQVPEKFDYIMWGDADDQFRGLGKMREAIDAHSVDAYMMNYLYAFDEYKNPIVVHPKVMVVKNDGSVEWAGRLHEDFKENRDVEIYFIKGVDRLHLTNDDRIADNKKRNLRIALQQLEDEPEDPRSYWNVGNSAKSIGNNEQALEAFDKFMETSLSDDERYIARLRRSEIFWNMGQVNKAIEESEYAIGKKPDFPDAYHAKGFFLMHSDQWEKATQAFLQGLVKKPAPLKIIVHNPRDYDYVPMMNLAKCYFALNRPTMALPLLEGCAEIYPEDDKLKDTIKFMKKEAEEFDEVVKLVKRLSKYKSDTLLKKEFDKIPDKYMAHPAVCQLRNNRFIKKESSGKDVVYYCGITKAEWDPEVAKTKGVGGSEEAVIHLAKKWVKAGYNVTVYNNCGYKEKKFDGVTYKPYWTWNYRDKQDVTILWRSTKPADYPINSDKVFLDLHDVIKPGELNKKRMERIDKVFVKSEWQKDLFPHVDEEKFVVVSNGIEPGDLDGPEKKDQYLIINTSSADRSISAVLEMFREIKKRVPKAKMKWAYGWGTFDIVHATDDTVMSWKKDILEQIEDTDGFEALGMISHGEVAKLYRTANIFLYPTEFAEIDCISITKAQAAGAWPISTDFAALGGKTKYGDFTHSEKTAENYSPPYKFDFALEDPEKRKEMVDATVERLNNPIQDVEDMKEWARDNYNWDKVSKVWLKHIE